jgi:hypothetical protein
MQRIAFTIAIALGCLQSTAFADDLQYYKNQNPFELSTKAKQDAAIYSYDSPLYRGLWPMTIEAFKQLDWTADRESSDVKPLNFAFPVIISDDGGFVIASHPADPVQNFAGRSYKHPLYDGLWPMTVKSFRRSDLPVDEAVFTFNIAMNN